jgi:hypothetical protein
MSAQQDESNKRQSTIRSRLRRIPLVKRLWWWGCIQLPWLVPTPSLHPDYRDPERDRKRNKETELPPEENVNVLAFWATEAYGPAEIEVLYAGLEALSWDKGRLGHDNSGSVDWIKQQRQIGSEGTFNLGIVHRAGATKYIHQELFAELPPGVEYLIVEIHQVCPSLTCLQIVFVLSQDRQRVYTDQLKLERTTIHEPIGGRLGAYKILDPGHQKQRAIESHRRELQVLAAQWFRRYFPGVFCSTTSGSLPTAELITTRHASLFDDPNAPSSLELLSRLLANCSPYSAWKNTKHQSFMFATHDTANGDVTHLVITLPEESIAEDAVKHYGGRDQPALVAFVQGQLDGILVRFAVIALLNSFRRTLMQTRDKLRVASPRKRRVLKSLDYIQNFFGASLQVPSIVGEVASATKKPHSYRWTCDGFVEVIPFRDEPPAKLYERLSTHTNSLANRLLNDDRATRESFKQISEVVVARESVKAQRRMEFLTVVAIAVAALSLWIALPPFEEWRAKLPAWIKQNLETPECPHQVQSPPVSSSPRSAAVSAAKEMPN